MKFIKKNLYVSLLLMSLMVLPLVTFAQQPTPNSNGGQPTPASTSTTFNPVQLKNPIPNVHDIPGFIKTLLTGALRAGIPVIALAIIYCGFLFVAARGNPEKITKAKSALLYTLLGTAILLGAWAIATLIANTVSNLG